ncbi:unnamed protein product, partial [marine sediment metagenome]
MKVIPNIRRGQILDYLSDKKAKTASLAELYDYFNISVTTLRRDIDILTKENSIRKVHGGVVLKKEIDEEPLFSRRINKLREEKRRIAKEAITRVSDRDIIFLNCGTTCMEIAELINIKKNIKAITIAPHILNKLSYLNNNNNFSGEVMCSGGILRKDPSDIFVGPRAINFFNGMRITISFFGVLSISLEEGWMVSSFFEAEITKAVLEKSEKVIGVCD